MEKNQTETKQFISRLPKALHEWLKRRAFAEKKTMQKITIEALEELRKNRGDVRIDIDEPK